MNRKLINILLLFVISILSANAQENVRAQDATDQLKKQLSVYLAEHPSSNLYLHLDKNIYSPEETIWFKAYLLSDTVTANKVLYVRITNEDKETVLSGQFPMYDIRAHGNLQLPGKLTEGKYTLYAYTDLMLSYGDTNVFVQPIQIRKHTGRKLEAEALVSDTTQLVRGSKVQVMARIRESGKLAKNIKGEYELIGAGKTIKYGRLNTNLFGEAFINFTYPELTDEQSLKVKMLFTRDNDYAELSLNLPHEGNPLKVKIHPEGGQLVAGVTSKVAIEALDIHENPVSTELLVKNAGQLVTKVRTNKLGVATIILKPETGSSYTVETTGKKKQTIPFPQVIKPGGYSLKLHNSKEQCTVTVYNKHQQGNALLVLRSAKEILWSTPLTIAPGDSVNIPVPVASFPKNIMSLSVFDHENKPQAERLFLNREEEDYKVTILTDRKDYGMQKKVTVKINIADTQGNPVVANLSIATTEKNRIDSANFRNILQFWYYRPFGKANLNRFLSVKSASEMDGLLTASSWNSNTWSKISSYLPQGPTPHLDLTDGVIGLVIPTDKKSIIKEINIQSLKKGHDIRKAIEENISFFSKLTIQVNTNNTFFIPSSSLISPKDQEWVLDLPPDRNNPSFWSTDFLVVYKDHDILFDSIVFKGQLLSMPSTIGFFSNVKNPMASSFNFQGTNQLAEVTIGDKEITTRKKLKIIECSDRICSGCGCLNCSYYPKYRPIKGKIYVDKVLQKKIIYLGCGNYRDINYIKNITIPEEFPLPDYDTIPHPNEDTRSTIYWNPDIVTDANGTATFSFYTSDIQGEFEIIAQGLEVNTFKPLMGTGHFTVKINE